MGTKRMNWWQCPDCATLRGRLLLACITRTIQRSLASLLLAHLPTTDAARMRNYWAISVAGSSLHWSKPIPGYPGDCFSRLTYTRVAFVLSSSSLLFISFVIYSRWMSSYLFSTCQSTMRLYNASWTSSDTKLPRYIHTNNDEQEARNRRRETVTINANF